MAAAADVAAPLDLAMQTVGIAQAPPVEVHAGLQHKYSKITPVKAILTAEGEGLALAGKTLVIGGWVKTGREQGKGTFAFLEVNDGSCAANLQVIVDQSVHALAQLTPTGTSVIVEGVLKESPESAKKQKVELKATRILHVGVCDPSTYPVAKTKLSLEFLRSVGHLRARTNTLAAIARIRNALAYATHKFFQENGFLYIHTPIITTSDCEGAGEMFQVTTLLHQVPEDPSTLPGPPSPEDLDAAKAAVTSEGDKVRLLKEEKKSKSEVKKAVESLQMAKEALAAIEARAKVVGGLPRTDKGGINYAEDFFGRQAYLTVSGQLQVETYACGLSNVYTFGPTFRAENSHTSRHLAEFWMIEPEIAFADIEDDMNCAEDYVKYLSRWLLENCRDDLEFMKKMFDATCIERLEMVASAPFVRITYTEAVDLLQKVTDKKFENKVEWGIDLASEHERHLTEGIFQKPVIVYNYPKDIKAFYMRLNDDNKTVAAMDLLVPKVGELVGGSQREERLEVLERRLEEMNLPKEPYEWYLDTRRFGTVKHAGFGLGFERMILFATGMENIRDVIPFPRWPGKADL